MDTREISQLIERVSENVTKMGEGTLITHEWLVESLNVDRRKQKEKYYGLVGKLKRNLEKHYNIFLTTEHKQGYRYTIHGDEHKSCEGQCNKGIKGFLKGVRRFNFIDLDKIKDPVKKTKTLESSQRCASLAGLVKLGMPKVQQKISQ